MRLNTIFKGLGMANECSSARTWHIFSNHAVSLTLTQLLSLTHTRARARARTHTHTHTHLYINIPTTNNISNKICSHQRGAVRTIRFRSCYQTIHVKFPRSPYMRLCNTTICDKQYALQALFDKRWPRDKHTTSSLTCIKVTHNAVMPTSPQVSSQKRLSTVEWICHCGYKLETIVRI